MQEFCDFMAIFKGEFSFHIAYILIIINKDGGGLQPS